MNGNILSIQNLMVTFKDGDKEINLINNLNLELKNDEIFVLAGESGSGKSLTIKAILQLLPTQAITCKSGSIIYRESEDLLQLSSEKISAYRGNKISLIGQDSLSGLNPTMKIGKQICEVIMFHKHLSYRDAKKETVNIMKQMKLSLDDYLKYPHMLSGGQRQRVMIAMAIVCNPEIILADEPTTALDPTTQMHILSIFKELHQSSHNSILFVTHDLRLASYIADRVAIIYSGSIMEIGEKNQIFSTPYHPYTLGLISALPNFMNKPKSHLCYIKERFHNISPNRGCSFFNRCPYAMQVCTKISPPVTKIEENHYCKCWLLDDRCNIRSEFEIWRSQIISYLK